MDNARQLKERITRAIGVPYCAVFDGCGAELLLREMMARELGERAMARGDEVILVGEMCEAEKAAIKALGLTGVCVAADRGATALEQALSPASKAVWVCRDATSDTVCTVRNFCNAWELWMLASVTEQDTRACLFDGKCYHVGAVADVAVGTTAADGACAFACTKDALPYHLIRATLKEQE